MILISLRLLPIFAASSDIFNDIFAGAMSFFFLFSPSVMQNAE